jgi:hypothetical protein
MPAGSTPVARLMFKSGEFTPKQLAHALNQKLNTIAIIIVATVISTLFIPAS